MQLALLIPEYFVWHYSKAIKLLLNIVTNFLWFVYHFFSVPVLANTIFEPLRGVGMDFALPSRFLGLLIKSVSLFCAYVIMALLVFVGVCLVAVWVLLPVTVFFLVFFGFKLLLV